MESKTKLDSILKETASLGIPDDTDAFDVAGDGDDDESLLEQPLAVNEPVTKTDIQEELNKISTGKKKSKKQSGRALDVTVPQITKALTQVGSTAKDASSSKVSPALNTSGTYPLMMQSDMSSNIIDTRLMLDPPNTVIEDAANQIIDNWAKANDIGITNDQRDCLITALSTNPNVQPGHFGMILFGYSIRGNHNEVEVRNVLNAMQDLVRQALASQRAFDRNAESMMSGLHGLATQIIKQTPPASSIPSSKSIIPVVKQTSVQDIPKTVSGIIPVPKPAVIVNAVTAGDIKNELRKTDGDGTITSKEEFYSVVGRSSSVISSMDPKHSDDLLDSFIMTMHLSNNPDKENRDHVWNSYSDFLDSID